MGRTKTIHEFLRRNGLTQRALAKTLGISDSHLSDILSGRRTPGLSLAVRISRATGVPVESLTREAA